MITNENGEKGIYMAIGISMVANLLVMPSVSAASAYGQITTVLINNYSGEVDGYATCGGLDGVSRGPVYHYGRGHIQSDFVSSDREILHTDFYGDNYLILRGDYIDVKVEGYQIDNSDGTLNYAGTKTWIWGDNGDNEVIISWYDPMFHAYKPWYRVTAPSDNGGGNGIHPI